MLPMTYRRDPNLAWYVRDSNHPATKASGLLFAFIVMPVLIVLAWIKASDFDPYTTTFFTKAYVEPTASMPDELRIVGGLLFVIGVGLMLICTHGLVKARVTFRDIWIVMWVSVSIAAFAGAFFVAADSAAVKIEQETRFETRQT